MHDINKKHKQARESFFEAFCNLLITEEWGSKLIRLAEEKCAFVANYHYILFPEGRRQIIEEFEAWQDQKMLDILHKEEEPQKVREKIQRAIEARILVAVEKEVILKQNALFMLPANITSGAKCYFNTCDLIWRYAGDKSDDFNYYSKRALLLGVYASARLYYLSDQSEKSTKTKEFIATSLDSIINIASIKNKLKLPVIMENIPILRLFS